MWCDRSGKVRRQIRARGSFAVGAGRRSGGGDRTLFATVLFGRALETMRGLRPQWNVDGVLVTAIDLELNGTDREAGLVWQSEVRRRIAVLPGVEAVSWATKLPIGGRASLGLTQPVGTEPGAGPAVDGSLNRISPDYFRSMGIAVRRGRDFTDDDRAELRASRS
jgi:hypothetical protein